MNEIINTHLYPKEIDVLDSDIYNYEKGSLSLTLFENSQNILLSKVTNLIERSPAFMQFLDSLNPQEMFDVNMSNMARTMYEKGEWVLKYSKTKSGLLPTLCDKAGKFTEQVTLNPKSISPNLSSSLMNLSMQQQLGQLMDQLESMNNTIQRIERGQRDDRIGLFYSARQQYIEAISMTNIELQEQGLLNAAKTANNARFMMMQTMRSDIDQILYNKKLKKQERDSLSNNVRESMQYINESTGLCIVCFSALGVSKPLLASVKSYQCFIDQSLLCKDKSGLTKAQMLHQNWNGNDNEWLNLPKEISSKLDYILSESFDSPALIDIGSGESGNL